MVEINVTNRDSEVEIASVTIRPEDGVISLEVTMSVRKGFPKIIAHVAAGDCMRLAEALDECLDEACSSERKPITFRDPRRDEASWFFLARHKDASGAVVVSFSYTRRETDFELFLDERDCAELSQALRDTCHVI